MHYLFWFVLALIGASGTAWAADDAPKDENAASESEIALAKQHHTLAKEAYERGDFGTACAEFANAYAVGSRVEEMYNLGLCNEGLGDLKAAIDSYSQFTAALTDHPKRSETIQKIALLDRLAANLKAGELTRPTIVKTSKVLPWTAGGFALLSIVSAVTGGVLYANVANGAADLPNQCVGLCEDYKQPLRMQLDVSRGMFAAAAATGATSVLIGAIYAATNKKMPEVLASGSVTPNSVSVTLYGRF